MKSAAASHLPLNAIRAFEATIRLGSITAAAAELNVTQGAVSRQVKNLEIALGLRLVNREGHTVQPTPTGQSLAIEFTNALRMMTEAIKIATRKVGTFRLQVSPSFANRWLLPRMDQLQRAVPDVELALTTTLANNQFDDRSFDAGIIYGNGHWDGLETTLLLKEVLVPVCAPSLVNGVPPPQKPSDLNHHMLLHAKIDHSDWSNWLKSIGASNIKFDTGPSFETMDLAISAAEHGFGITLGNVEFVKEMVRESRLIQPFGPARATEFGYYLVYPKHTKLPEEFDQCVTWLSQQSPQAQV